MKNRTQKITFSYTSSLKYLLLAMGLFLFLSCKFTPNIQEEGVIFLQGKWSQTCPPSLKQRISYTLHQFTFACDSFYVHLTTHSKTNYYATECFNKGIWHEYAKGRYVMQKDTLFLFGTFTKANYKQKISGCYRIGEYIEKFIIETQRKDTLQLKSLNFGQKISLYLKEKTICTPKPL